MFAWIQCPCRLWHCEHCTPCTMIKSVKWVRCQSSLIDGLIASTHRSGKPISPGGSNRTICAGPNCWMISWIIPCWNCDCWIWLIGDWSWYESRLMFILPFGAAVAPLAVMWYLSKFYCSADSGSFSVLCTIYCLYAPVYVGTMFLDNACLIFLQH